MSLYGRSAPNNLGSGSGGGGGSGTVSSVSVVSANGLAGTVANPTATPAITLSTTVTGILQGDGTAISAASGVANSISWSNRTLSIASGTVVENWNTQTLNDSSGITSIFWGARGTYDASGTISVDWGSRTLKDTAGVESLVWGSRAMADSSDTGALNWQNRNLQDTNSNQSILWGSRDLITLHGVNAANYAAGLKSTNGTTVQRGTIFSGSSALGTGDKGVQYFDTTLSAPLWWDGAAWTAAVAGGPFLPLAGGTMTGAIAMGSNKITGLANGTVSGDSVNFGQLSLYVPLTEVGAANGVASLDSGGKVPFSQLPSTLMSYLGAWGASTNTPTLADGTGDVGDTYRVSVAGTQNLGSGSQTFFVGDFIIYNGSIWQRSPAADGVISVNGASGAVTVNAINQLTGDVTAAAASGSQSKASTVAAIQGVTVSGTTGTGNVVFSASPTVTGVLTAATVTASGAVTGSNLSGTNTGDQTLAGLGVRAGSQTVSSGSTSQAITYGATLGGTSYSVVVTFLNTVDANPQFQPITVIAKSATGFTASWNAPTATANYVIQYLAILNV